MINESFQWWRSSSRTVFKYNTSCAATIKTFTLTLCGLPLWLLVSIEVSKFAQYHSYLSSVSLRLQKAYPNTCILWFKRQMDLELMFFSIIYLRTVNWKWTKFFKNLLALVLAYSVFILTVNSFTFLPRSERNIFTFFRLNNSSAVRGHFFRFQLRHHTCLIKLT